MKKLKLLSAIAMAGLLGLSARAATPAVNFELVNIKLTALFQTNNTDSSSKIIKVKITNKDALKLIAGEFTSTPGITNKGAKLAINSYFSGTFAVLDKTNGVILANASNSTNSDNYNLFIENDGNSIDAFKDTTPTDTENFTAVTFFEFESGDGTIFGDLFGAASVKETFSNTKDIHSESFKFSGVEDVDFNSNEGVLEGTISGSALGDDNDSID
jgi:hypothetical protein